VAADIAAGITAAIVKKGYTWEWEGGYVPHKTFVDALRAELGDVAVEVVRRSGGWKILHDNYWEMDAGIFKAQLRGQIEAIFEMHKAGRLNEKNFLNHSTERQQISESSFGVKKLLELKTETEGPK
jgi:hypothetical protein